MDTTFNIPSLMHFCAQNSTLMKHLKDTLVIALLLFAVNQSVAQQIEEKRPLHQPKWGLETNILWPIFPGNLIRVQATRTLWQRNDLKGDLLVGFNVNFPQDRDTEGRFSDYSLVTGYRQYLFRGFHVEVNQQIGYGNLRNHVTTGQEYQSLDWGAQLLGGYKYDIPNSRWYTAIQLGIGGTVYQSDPWPIYTDDTLEKEVGNEIIFIGGIQLGIRF